MNQPNYPLIEEFYRYESENQLTADERCELLAWVKEGNSVHENPSMAEDGHGNYVDFIKVFREEKEMHDTLDTMTPRERNNYLAKLRGEDTIDNLRETIDKLYFEISILEKVINKHKLQDEVARYKHESAMASKKLEEYLKSDSCEELPFT